MSRTAKPNAPASHELASPQEALAALLAQLGPVGIETVELAQASGRVLAEPIVADRDSPAADLSAMDGFAVHVGDAPSLRSCDVTGEAMIGRLVAPLSPGRAMRIVTGAVVPAGADAVIPREDVTEETGRIILKAGTQVAPGQNIRRQGENLRAGQVAIKPGTSLTPAAVSVAATFGAERLVVYRRVRVGLIVTGDELLGEKGRQTPFLSRDSNGPALAAMLAGQSWIELRPVRHAADDPAAITRAISSELADCDAVLLTGGVSMGDRDHVPAAVAAVGARTVFHRLAIKPGKPLLGAVGPAGQAILGLPGNPVSALITARRFASAALNRLAGLCDPDPAPPQVTIVSADEQRLPRTWFRLVRLVGPGAAELVPEHGSGDVVAAARSDGFVQVAPNKSAVGSWPFYSWRW